MRRKLRLIKLALAAVVLISSGCSFSNLYRQLDWLVPWYVSDYITLDEKQQSELESRLLAQLEWHCSTQLVRYANWFRQLHDTPDAFTRVQLDHHYETTRRFWRELMVRISPDTTRILATASDAQIAELIGNLERKRREREKEYSEQPLEVREQMRLERMIRLLERWLGELGPKQRDKLKAWSAALGNENENAWRDNSRHWQARFIAALAQRKDGRRFARQVHTLLVEPETLWSAEYRRGFEYRKALTLDMLAAVANSMTPVQHSHLQHELLSWAEEFESLACTLDEKPGQSADD